MVTECVVYALEAVLLIGALATMTGVGAEILVEVGAVGPSPDRLAYTSTCRVFNGVFNARMAVEIGWTGATFTQRRALSLVHKSSLTGPNR